MYFYSLAAAHSQQQRSVTAAAPSQLTAAAPSQQHAAAPSQQHYNLAHKWLSHPDQQHLEEGRELLLLRTAPAPSQQQQQATTVVPRR